MKLKMRFFLLSALVLLFAANLQANNITVSNISLTQRNATDDYTMVQFDLSWENSWRTSNLNGDGVTNWDAAWVFVKYRVAGGVWQHAWLNNDGHSGTGATIFAGLQTPGSAFNATTNPGVGVFIYRSADGTGTFSITGAKLRWNYGANGVAEDASVEVKVFAIEMVYVPEGAFYVGSGGTESGSFTDGSWSSGATVPLLISSENALSISQSAGNLWGTSSSGFNTIGGTGTLAATFPKGSAGFYCMKYEISQQQYVDFLNTLTRVQQDSRTGTSLAAGTTTVSNRYVMSNTSSISFRNGIRCDAMILANDPITFYCDLNGNDTGGEAGDGQWIACSCLNWSDCAAYADWTGLRPMTELEYEKACRGTAMPVANEYAWGTSGNTPVAGINNIGAANETASNSGNGLCVFGDNSSVRGPLRVGALATSTTTTRAAAGASYYGMMELSGNLWEWIVTVGQLSGRAYTGLHGNGTISVAGFANVAAWPGLSSGEVIYATGSGQRGGNWYNNANYGLGVSDRPQAVNAQNTRPPEFGFRLVRTWSFVCGEDKVTDIDGNTYNTVQVGTQCWMKENLNVTKKPDGTAISRYCYGNIPANCTTYGGLYTWGVMMNGSASSNTVPSGVQGICPDGWHVPADAEWAALKTYVSSQSAYLCNSDPNNIAKALATTTNWVTSSDVCAVGNNLAANNLTGFSALPGGFYYNGGFLFLGSNGSWWTSLEQYPTTAWSWLVNKNSSTLDYDWNTKTTGCSVRCIMD